MRQLCKNGGIFHGLDHTGGKFVGITWRKKAVRPVAANLFGNSGEIGSNDRDAAQNGLRYRSAESLRPQRRHDEAIYASKKTVGLDISGKVDGQA